MGNKFETRLLGELCHEITVGFVGTMTNEYIENGIPFLRSKNIDEYDVKWDDMKYVSSEFHKKLSKSALKPGDVAIVRTGKPGTTCVIPNDLREANCSDIVIARVNNELLCPHYLSYFMNAMAHGQVNAHIVGAVQQHFNVSSAKKLEIPLPSKVKQIEIVHVLKALDDKLKLNRKINQTLEQMAQTLFKSWFVDFDPVIDNALDAGFFEQDLAFSEELLHRVEMRKSVRESDNFKPLPEDIRQLFPHTFEECAEPALGLGGWIPNEWHYDCFGELLSSTIGGDWGKDAQDEKHTVQSRIVRGTDIPDLGNGQLSGAPLRWVEPKKLKSRQIEVGDIIIEVSGGSPTQSTGRSLFITQSMLERLGGVVEPASFCRRFEPKSYTLGMLASIHLKKIYSDGKMWEYQNQSTGIANFQTKFFLDTEQVLLPSDEVLDKFTKTVQPFIEKSQNNEQIELTKLRDTLLPKLISGELSLSELKTAIPEEILI